MRYLAIDYGLKRVGLALCDPSETIVSPLQQLPSDANHPQRLIQQLQQIIVENQIEEIVLGLPLNMDDSESEQTRITRKFAAKLSEALGLQVHLQDERLSSSVAQERLTQAGLSRRKQKDKKDMLAACTILEDFLNKTN